MVDDADREERLPTRIVLVRHGEAHCNADRFVGGHDKCTGLTSRGVRQVEALRDRWKGSGELGSVHALYSSTLARARQTASILAPALGDLDATADCDLCEFHTGSEADGLPWSEFDQRYSHLYDGARDPFGRPLEGEGWESIEEFRFRVGRSLFRLAREHEGETVVLAVHGGIIDLSMSIFLNLPVVREHRPAELYTYNASVTEWERPAIDGSAAGDGIPKAGSRARWRLVRYNDAAHVPELT